jgi:hypothetical protein
MGRSKIPFQPLATELETVAAAFGVRPNHVTREMIEALAAGLAHTTSPLKDAVEHLLNESDLRREYKMLIEEWRDLMIDVHEQLRTRSAMEPINWHQAREEAIIEELQEVIFQLI